MHKEEGGNIDINVGVCEEKSLLKVTICDDGIGRARAAEIRLGQAVLQVCISFQLTEVCWFGIACTKPPVLRSCRLFTISNK